MFWISTLAFGCESSHFAVGVTAGKSRTCSKDFTMSAAGSPVADGSPYRIGTCSAWNRWSGTCIPHGASSRIRCIPLPAAATQALNSLSSTSGASTSSGDWFKVLPKPSTFDPKDREGRVVAVPRLVVASGAVCCGSRPEVYWGFSTISGPHMEDEMALVEQISWQNEEKRFSLRFY